MRHSVYENTDVCQTGVRINGDFIRTVFFNNVHIADRFAALTGRNRHIVLCGLCNRLGQSHRGNDKFVEVRRFIPDPRRCRQPLRAAVCDIPAVVIVDANRIFAGLKLQGDRFLAEGIVRERVHKEVPVCRGLQIPVINHPRLILCQLAQINRSRDFVCVSQIPSGQSDRLTVSRFADENVIHLECIIVGCCLYFQIDFVISIC